MRQMVSKSINFSSLGMLALVLACKKPPEVATPDLPIEEVAEKASDIVEEAVEEVVEAADTVADTAQDSGGDAENNEGGQAESGSDMEYSTEDSEKQYGEELNNAVALLAADETTQAGLNALEDLSLKAKDLPQVFYNIGVANLKLGNATVAEEAFRQAIQIDPNFSKSWVNLGVIYERRRDFNTAFDLYSEGLEHNETDVDLVAGQVSCLRKMKRYDEAIEYAQAALKKNANNISAYNEIGTVYLEQEDYSKALFILEQAMLRNGGTENALIQSNLGKVYYAEGKIPQAKTSFSKAIELDPNLIDAALLLSFIHLDNRAWAAAEEVLSNAIQLEPNNAAILNSMGIAKRGLGKIDEAEKLYREALVFEPDNLEPLLNLAILEADYRNKYDEAFVLLDEYISSGGEKKELVNKWTAEFEKSKKAYEREQRKREFFLKRQQAREEAERKAEEERKRQEALQEDQPPERDGDFDQFNGVEGAENEDSENPDDAEEGTEEAEEGTGEEGANDQDTDASDEEAGEGTDEIEGDNASDSDQNDAQEEPSTEADESSGETENSWGAPIENTEENEATGESGEESIDENEAGDEQVETSEDSETSADTDTEEIPTENDENVEGTETAEGSWGEEAREIVCVAIDSCEDISQQCSHEGTCLPKGQSGTYELGESCSDSTECAFGLECQDQMCFDGGQ